MKQNFIRLGILMILIILCIGQTVQLWLGDMSGHTFFVDTSQNILTQPKNIWMNYNGLAYRVDGSSNENREGMLMELMHIIKMNEYNIRRVSDVKYRQLLEDEGFVYEYALPLTLGQIVGTSINPKGMKNEYINIMTIFVKSHKGDNKIYLIDDKDKVCFSISFDEKMQLHDRINSYYTDSSEEINEKTYQASMLNSNYMNIFERNIFYPLDNTNSPFIYDALSLNNVIPSNYNQKIETLETYVDSFFKNPDYKHSYDMDSGYVFSDALDMNVFYNYEGYLEFNQRYEKANINVSKEEQLAIINKYIYSSKQIPNTIKQGIFLKEIKENDDTGEVRYRFGYKYNGFEVLLSERFIDGIGMDAFVEIGINENQIVYGKWIMKEIEIDTYRTKEKYNLTKEGYVAISDTEKMCNIDNLEEDKFSNMQCAYIVENDDKIDFTWATLYKGRWYYK